MKTAFQLKSYFRFLWKSSNQHGVHSPFVFNLVTKCFYNKIRKTDHTIPESKRKSLTNSDTTIQNTDFNIYKYAALLSRIIHYFKPQSILEIGNSNGFITTLIQSENPKTKIIVFDVSLKNKLPVSLDLAYFNAPKTSLFNINTFEDLLTKIHNDSFFIFEGIHKTPLMEQLWETIKTHEKVTVTIDIYNFGLVFFRKEQAKEHFIIRV